jgi:hypothetical protein
VSEASTKAAIEARAAEIAASLGPSIPVGVTPAEAALIADIHVALPILEAAIDERIRQLTPSGAIVGGTVTVANTMINATDRIKLTKRTAGGTEGYPRVSALTAATSFVITSSSGADTSTFEWEF